MVFELDSLLNIWIFDNMEKMILWLGNFVSGNVVAFDSNCCTLARSWCVCESFFFFCNIEARQRKWKVESNKQEKCPTKKRAETFVSPMPKQSKSFVCECSTAFPQFFSFLFVHSLVANKKKTHKYTNEMACARIFCFVWYIFSYAAWTSS